MNDNEYNKAAVQFISDARAATFNEFGELGLQDLGLLPSTIGEVYFGTGNVYIFPASETCATPLAWWRKGVKQMHIIEQFCGCSLCMNREKNRG